ncbi:MAG TPA: rod shape-determining protein MreC [Xanthomonadaceae bacterium]|nr:rod shape-determining protein MreC [Xanthomonadaceae bacterium]
MPAYAGSPAPKPGDVAGTLRLLAYLALAITLAVLDHRGGWLAQLRARGETLAQPVWWLAGLPGRMGDDLRDTATTRDQLARDNKTLRNALMISGARLARLQAAAAENARLRGLLAAAQRGGLDVQLAPILDVDLDPTRQRLVLDAGRRDGIEMGQSVIDAGGLLGQVVALTPQTATVLLLTDPDHAVPVVVARNGVRLVAYGQGRSDQLRLPNIPISSDVKVGDAVVTSGLGGRFPAGFPVGTITALQPDESRAFLVGDVKPAAQLDRGRDVLLLRKEAEAAAQEGAAPGTTVGATRQAARPAGPGDRPSPPTPVHPAAPAGKADATPVPPTTTASPP